MITAAEVMAQADGMITWARARAIAAAMNAAEEANDGGDAGV